MWNREEQKNKELVMDHTVDPHIINSTARCQKSCTDPCNLDRMNLYLVELVENERENMADESAQRTLVSCQSSL